MLSVTTVPSWELSHAFDCFLSEWRNATIDVWETRNEPAKFSGKQKGQHTPSPDVSTVQRIGNVRCASCLHVGRVFTSLVLWFRRSRPAPPNTGDMYANAIRLARPDCVIKTIMKCSSSRFLAWQMGPLYCQSAAQLIGNILQHAVANQAQGPLQSLAQPISKRLLSHQRNIACHFASERLAALRLRTEVHCWRNGRSVDFRFTRVLNLFALRGRCDVVVRLLASHRGEPDSIPGGVGPRMFVCGNRVGRCRWSAGFPRGLPFTPSLHSGAAPYSPRFTLVGFHLGCSDALGDSAFKSSLQRNLYRIDFTVNGSVACKRLLQMIRKLPFSRTLSSTFHGNEYWRKQTERLLTMLQERGRSATLYMLPEADSRRWLTTVGPAHLHVFLVRCPDDKIRRPQCYAGLYQAQWLVLSAPFTGQLKRVSATVFRKVLLQSRSCPGSMFESVIRQAVQSAHLTVNGLHRPETRGKCWENYAVGEINTTPYKKSRMIVQSNTSPGRLISKPHLVMVQFTTVAEQTALHEKRKRDRGRGRGGVEVHYSLFVDEVLTFCDQGNERYYNRNGAFVIEWLARSLPIKVNQVQSPVRSPDFSHVAIVPDDAVGQRVFSGISRFPPPLHSSAAPYSPRFILHRLSRPRCYGGRRTVYRSPAENILLKNRPTVSAESLMEARYRRQDCTLVQYLARRGDERVDAHVSVVLSAPTL
ncbi:hypothetical protein PR048_022365 [Dryococelus australis]|uniref:Uncharacterized protein n=1 Tax=Dryococelus australis TaxID=614101 RepID=A0ABQ9H0S8_9NEOP|nr:hypothetical protein PR048_022365 [Dryococelus australis]